MRKQKENIFFMLQSVYNCIDRLCEKHGIQKVEVKFPGLYFPFFLNISKTVGNNYVACTGIKAYDVNLNKIFLKDKSERMIDLAFEVIEEVSMRVYGPEENDFIRIRVGIHGGRVISDIIGDHKVQFSLFGDPVNTTSRIASKAEECTVTISDFIYQKVKNHADFIFKQAQIEVSD